MWFQIGRLLFPELINRPRAMRLRMFAVFTALALMLVLVVVGVVVKVSRASGTSQDFTKPIKAPPM